MTDFGTRDDSAALLRGTILSIAREAAVVDLTHEVPPYDVEEGARLLEDAPGIFPPGTVFVAVVDPGVGTERRPLALRLGNGSWLVGPDNGVLSIAAARWGVASARAIEDRRFLRETVSATFQGRDVFAPAAAHLAAGVPPPDEIGPEVHNWRKLAPEAAMVREGKIEARVLALDEPYGNVWTNVTPAEIAKLGLAPGAALVFDFGAGKRVEAPLARTFGDVPEGEPLAYFNSRGRLALAINRGNAARTYGAVRGAALTISRAR
jgi:S-adenosylmethionine hydrolase